MDTMEIGGRTFPIVGYVKRKSNGQVVPLVDIPMMSDYKWQLQALQDRLEYPEKYRHTGEDVEAVIAQLRQWLAAHSEEADG